MYLWYLKYLKVLVSTLKYTEVHLHSKNHAREIGSKTINSDMEFLHGQLLVEAI